MILAQNDVSAWLQLAAAAGCMALLIAAAIGDVRHYRISNRLVGAVVVCFAIFVAAKASWIFLGWSLAAAASMFVVVAALFAFGLFGGGDVKLAAAMALWTQFADLPRFLLVMSAVGGCLGVVWIVRRRMQKRAPVAATPVAATPVAATPVDATSANAMPADATSTEAIAAPANSTIVEASHRQYAHPLPNKLPYGVAIAAAGIDFFLFSANSPLAGLLSIQ